MLFCLVSVVCLVAGCEDDEINAPVSPCKGLISITDINGNVYEVVEIGSQCWMKENLRTTRYRDSTVIIERNYLPPEQFYDNVYLDAWYWAKSDQSEDSIYGKLYTWAAVNSSHGICPSGWHAPSQSEFDTLIN